MSRYRQVSRFSAIPEIIAHFVDAGTVYNLERADLAHPVMKRFQITFISCSPLELIARILRREIRFGGNAALKCYLEAFRSERALILASIYKVPGVQIADW